MTQDTNGMWAPFGMNSSGGGNEQTLVPGIPKWLTTSLYNWLVKRFTILKREQNAMGYVYNNPYFDIPLLRQAERICQLSIPFTTEFSHDKVVQDGVSKIFSHAGGEMEILRLVDFVLIDCPDGLSAELNSILIECASAYQVGSRAGKKGLVQRLPEGVQENAERVIGNSGRAGAILAEAWNDVYALSPQPSDAYVKAVKAVEEATVQKIVPKQANANLGHVAGQLEADGDWYLPFTVEREGSPSSKVVSDLVRLLWHGHHDRHAGGSQGMTVISQEEAETAVSIAVILVQWFSEDRVQRRPLDEKRVIAKKKSD